MDFHLRQRADGRQIRLLSCWAGGVRCSGNPGGEILQPLDCVRAWNQLLNQLNRIEPTERRALNRPVVEVEAVDIDIGPNGFPPNSKGRSEKRPLSRQHAAGGYVAQSSGSSRTTQAACGRSKSREKYVWYKRLYSRCGVCTTVAHQPTAIASVAGRSIDGQFMPL